MVHRFRSVVSGPARFWKKEVSLYLATKTPPCDIFTYSRTDARGAWAQFLVKVHSIFVYLAKSDFNVEFDLCGTN